MEIPKEILLLEEQRRNQLRKLKELRTNLKKLKVEKQKELYKSTKQIFLIEKEAYQKLGKSLDFQYLILHSRISPNWYINGVPFHEYYDNLHKHE